MTERIEYGGKTAADAARDRHSEHLCPVDDDRRLKTVAYASDAPDSVLDTERLEAADGRAERSDGPGQAPLSDNEKDRIDFSADRANVPHARAVKGIAQAEGVEDWVAYYDGTLTVDEHREVMERAATESGKRTDDTESADEKAGRAARSARSNQCDHAKGHCQHGDPEACEFLVETCEYSEQEIDQLLADRAPESRPEPTHPDDRGPLTGKQKGALKRSWTGYKGAIEGLEAAISALQENWKHAQQAARAINAVRTATGQELMHFDRLEEEQADLLDLTREMAADCHECHADHGRHDHNVTTGDTESLPSAVTEGVSSTPVGTSDDEREDLSDS